MSSELDWLQIDPGNRIACPRRGEAVDLERCLGCNWLIDIDRAGSVPALRCGAARSDPDDAQLRRAPHID